MTHPAAVRIALVAATGLLLTFLTRAAQPPVSFVCEEHPRTPIPSAFPAPRVLGEPGHTNVTSVAFGTVDGHPVAVSTGQEGRTLVWSLPGLTPLPDPGPVTLPARASPVVSIHGRAVRVTADDELHLTDAATGRPAGPRMYLGEDNGVNALQVITLDGHPTAVVNDDGGDENEPGPDPLEFWDLVTGRELPGIDGDFSTVRQARVGGRTVLLTPNNRAGSSAGQEPPAGSVSVWDAQRRTRVALLTGNPPTPRDPGGPARYPYAQVALDTGRLDGRPVALTGGGDNVVRLWDLTTARQIAATEPTGHTDEITGIVTRPGYALTTGWDGRIITWDLATGRRSAIGGDDDPKLGAVIADADGRPTVVTQGNRMSQAWALPSLAGAGPAREIARVDRLDLLGSRPVVLRVSFKGERVRLLDARTGAPIGRTVHTGSHYSESHYRAFVLDGHPALVEVAPVSRVWDLANGRPPRSVRGMSDHLSPLPVTGRFRCATAMLLTRGTALRAWDPRTLRPLTPPMRGHRSPVTQIVYGTLGDRPIAVTSSYDRTIRVWDLTTATEIGPPLSSGRRGLPIALGYAGGHTYLLGGGSDERLRSWTLR
ncbi:hypothetical protein J5X84_41715 [Streptosporangiaceae bacterium NEAU-GS5]|nr:hypothetical protein [Streptosporangiaceae bacterium NEAU-GS5]